MYRGHRAHSFYRNAVALIALIAPLCASAQVDPGLPELPPPVRTIPSPDEFAAQQMKVLDGRPRQQDHLPMERRRVDSASWGDLGFRRSVVFGCCVAPQPLQPHSPCPFRLYRG